MKCVVVGTLLVLGLSVVPVAAQEQDPSVRCVYSLHKATKKLAVVDVTVHNRSDSQERIKVKAVLFNGKKKVGQDSISVNVPGGGEVETTLSVSTFSKADSLDVDCY